MAAVAGICALGLFPGCERVSERRLTDTEGRSFQAKCNREGTCTFNQIAAGGGLSAELVLRDTGRLVGICNAGKNHEPESPAACRALVCTSDKDCPPAHGMKDGQCLNGHCANPANTIDVNDSVMMCLAGLGLGRNDQRQIERYALGLNCGTPCRVPAPCAKP